MSLREGASGRRHRRRLAPSTIGSEVAMTDYDRVLELLVELLPDPCEPHLEEASGRLCEFCGLFWPCPVERARQITGCR